MKIAGYVEDDKCYKDASSASSPDCIISKPQKSLNQLIAGPTVLSLNWSLFS